MSGILGAIDLPALVDTTVYTVPLEKIATVNINMCNRGATTALVRIAVGTVALGNYIEYDYKLCANSVIERTGIVLSTGQLISVYSDITGVSVQVWGWEETV